MPEYQFRPIGKKQDTWGARPLILAAVVVLVVVFLEWGSIKAWYAKRFAPTRDDMRIAAIKKAKADPKNYMILWVGKTTLPAYERISPTQLAELPAKIEDLKGVDVLVDKDEIKGRIPIYDIPPGVAIAQSMLAPKDAKSGISAGIPQGCVATTLTEEQLSGEVARLKIGDRIALIANVMQTSKKPPIAVTTVISKDAKVLQPLKTHRLSGATGGEQPRKPGGSSPQQLISSMMGKKDKGGKELTDIVLAMPLADSLRLAQLPPKTELRVLLLSGLPGEDVEKLFSEGMEKGSEGAASSTLPTPVPPEETPEEKKVEVFRGTNRTVQSFPIEKK